MATQGRGNLVLAGRDEAALRINVQGCATHAAHVAGNSGVCGQLHAQLRLADARDAAELSDLPTRHAAPQQVVQGLAKAHDVLRAARLQQLQRCLG